eukprot:429458-Pleurochrysis_carterae.AAC.5
MTSSMWSGMIDMYAQLPWIMVAPSTAASTALLNMQWQRNRRSLHIIAPIGYRSYIASIETSVFMRISDQTTVRRLTAPQEKIRNRI